jgi:hypothetical protein
MMSGANSNANVWSRRRPKMPRRAQSQGTGENGAVKEKTARSPDDAGRLRQASCAAGIHFPDRRCIDLDQPGRGCTLISVARPATPAADVRPATSQPKVCSRSRRDRAPPPAVAPWSCRSGKCELRRGGGRERDRVVFGRGRSLSFHLSFYLSFHGVSSHCRWGRRCPWSSADAPLASLATPERRVRLRGRRATGARGRMSCRGQTSAS